MAEMIEIEVLACQQCSHVEPLPVHCGKPMQLVGNELVCWRGEHAPCCGRESKMPIPMHHDSPMVVKQARAEMMANGQFLIHEVR